MNNRYRLTITLLLAALLAGGNATAAGVKVGGNVYGGGNLASVGAGSTVNISGSNTEIQQNVYGGGNEANVTGDVAVTVSGGTIDGNVFGGGNLADVTDNVTVSVQGGTIVGDVYGGGALANTNTKNWDTSAAGFYIKVSGLTIGSSSVYGLYDHNFTEITDANATATNGETYYKYRAGNWNTTYNSAGTTTYKTKVELTGGTIRDVYGGALGDATHYATVYGDVLVVLNGTESAGTISRIGDVKGCIVNRIFGANNLYGTPMGHVKVQIEATQNKDKNSIDDKYNQHNDAESGNSTTYDVLQVYGGGNLSPYEPADALLEDNNTNHARILAARTEVIINGCDYTSIKQVYGGGNAASVPSSYVRINGIYDVEEVFGGGNGMDNIVIDNVTKHNPGANVGYYDYTHFVETAQNSNIFDPIDNDDAQTKEDRVANYRYGSGIATTEILGGNFYSVFGGSNSKGNISSTALTIFEDGNNTCAISVQETYGGGKNAPMDGSIVMDLNCVDIYLSKIFGGSFAADINSDINLTITNGRYGQVFGGNNQGGLIKGSITVNIEETGCHPIIIGELYGGGNQAMYSVYGYNTPIQPGNLTGTQHHPIINVISCTSIGAVYGGGLGTNATMYGSPQVNINMIPGRHSTSIQNGTANTLGTIGNVYGGGKQAAVIGNPIINIGTEPTVYLNTTYNVNSVSVYTYDNVSQKYTAPVQGANITGNVYGGGMEADVHGDAQVNIGTVAYTTNGYHGVTIAGDVYGGGQGSTTTITGNVAVNVGANVNGTLTGNSTITGNVYGGSALGAVNATKGANYATNPADITATNEKETNVYINAGTITGNVFGGGLGDLASEGTGHNNIAAKNYGNTTVTMVGGTVSTAVYGGANVNGILQGNSTVNIIGGTINTAPGADAVFGGGLGQNTSVVNNVTVNIGNYDAQAQSNNITGNATINGNIYGGSAKGSVNNADNVNPEVAAKTTYTHVNLYAGTVTGDVYGGGLGTADVPAQGNNQAVQGIAALVYGDVAVKLNEHNGTAVIGGSVFGCNNLKGTPKGDVTVDVYATNNSTGQKYAKLVSAETSTDPDYIKATDSEVTGHSYDLTGVFGGGNLATYDPTSGNITTVTIHGCGESSIKEVYGGGNAAHVPGCAVNVYGAYEIGYVYAGGKGQKEGINGATSDAVANVNGNAATTINGGTIYRTFAGANTNGDITGTSTLNIAEGTNTEANCQPKLGDVFSYGNLAEMNGTSNVQIGCLTNKVGALYGGAMNANINNNITLNVNGGTFAKVFGGNKSGGTIRGYIKVNVEQTGCDIEIDELYGCGNAAPYTTAYTNHGDPANYADPEVNIISCKSIGAVYGGGLGDAATVTGNPKVNINMIKATGGDYTSALGTIGNVYGGGNAAAVTGSPIVNIGTLTELSGARTVLGANISGKVFGGGCSANVDGNTTVKIGTVNYTVSGDVVGVTIGDDVYGAGEGYTTNVTGTATVNLGAAGVGNTTLSHDIYGGSAFGSAANTDVHLYNGSVANVYGGGKGQLASGNDAAYVAAISTKATVTLHNATITGAVYGGCNVNGTTATAEVNLLGGTIGTSGTEADKVFGGGQGHSTTTTTATVNVGSDTSTGSSTIYSNVYGGSALGAVGTAIVNLNSATSLTGHVFGGGMGDANDAASVTTATVNQNNITIASGYNIYGGCNENGTATTTNVNILGGSSNKIFGSGKGQNTTTTTANVYIGKEENSQIIGNATVTGDVYGGSELGTAGTTTVSLNKATSFQGEVFGGSMGQKTGVDGATSDVAADVTTSSTVYQNGISFAAGKHIYGGCNVNGSSAGTFVYVAGGTSNKVFGGGKKADMNGNATVEMTNGTVGYIYGGGSEADVNGNTTATVTGGTVNYDVFGAGEGQTTTVTGDVTVTIGASNQAQDGATATISGSVYGGSALGAANATKSGSGNNITYAQTSGKNTYVNVYSGAITGSVFGGGMGELNGVNNGTQNIAAKVYGKSTVTIGDITNEYASPTISGSVFGGNNINGISEGDVEVNVKRGSITGTGTGANLVDGNVHGGGLGQPTLVKGNVTVNIGVNTGTVQSPTYVGYATIAGNVYGGSALGNVNAQRAQDFTYSNYNCEYSGNSAATNVNLNGGTVAGSVFGGGLGQLAGGGNSAVASNVYGPVTVTVNGGTAANVFGCNDQNGAPQDKVEVYIKGTVSPVSPAIYAIGNVYGGGNLAAYSYANTPYPLKVEVSGGTINNVFGGGLGSTAIVSGNIEVEIKGGSVTNDVYGGGSEANVAGSVIVNISGGTVTNDVYGGGALAHTNTANWDGSTLSNDYYPTTELRLDSIVTGLYTYNESTYTEITTPNTKAQKNVTYYRYGTNHTTNVILTGGIIGNAYGGARGDATTAAYVYGDVTVVVDGAAFTDTYYPDNDIVPKTGRVFAANNINGTPKGNVTVTVWSTSRINGGDHHKGEYEIQSVYGGGNLADYDPENGKKTQVNIHGCEETSIQYVYGGGNSASVRSSEVIIYGSYEIGTAFGGGNGSEMIKDAGGNWVESPGADVNGLAHLILKGGTIHSAFAGSNTKGTCVRAEVDDKNTEDGECVLKITDLYGGGKSATVEKDVKISISGCSTDDGIENIYAGSFDARIYGDVVLNIRSGVFQNVYGGNNFGGLINGTITVNIEETDDCGKPIIINNLFGGGNNAAYPCYDWTHNKDTLTKHEPVSDPKITVNIKSATRIDSVYGGGYGVNAKVYGNTEVNVNMIKGSMADSTYLGQHIPNSIGTIGNIYGGGNKGAVHGDTYVNIGTETEIGLDTIFANLPQFLVSQEIDDNKYRVLGAKITGNVYGGGSEADVTGNTYVNIGVGAGVSGDSAIHNKDNITIAGDVYGGGKGNDKSFWCEAAMVGVDGDNTQGTNGNDKGTSVKIGNGTVNGSVYGGGQIGRVEWNTVVTVGLQSGTSAPVIKGNVFGAGKGLKTHGYSALVRGNTDVTIQADAKIGKSVYGGGEIASVGKYNVADSAYHSTHPDVGIGMPYSLANSGSGYCHVTVRDNAEIGPDNMQMKKVGGPDDLGHVFGAGKGVLPEVYTYADEAHKPWRLMPGANRTSITDYFAKDSTYFKFIETLALATQTEVVIGGNAFVKGSVYGGSENGRVQYDTHVVIQDNCQIGNGDGKNRRYTSTEWANENPADFKECAHWDYVATDGAPYDKFALYENNGKYYYDRQFNEPSEGGYYMATDGRTYYGNVFGGGSGVIPYAPGKWHRAAGSVGGNTRVDITGGHILTSIYGGNEHTDVGAYASDSLDNPVIPVSGGKCVVNMTGGTLGVPRTLDSIASHPVTCYVFGAGKGDQRTFFNTWTNVINTVVNITGNARVFGSVFGGGEDGHVIDDAIVNIGDTVTIGNTLFNHTNVKIGTYGTSYVDGNIFGGGRGFSGISLTAGTVGGNVNVNIKNGIMLGSVYGGGRLASVGYYFISPSNPLYGQLQDDDNTKTHGHVTVNISGGTIGNDVETILVEHTKGGNVFGGSMGRLTLMDNETINPIWPKLGQVKTATVNITGGTVKGNVYGGGEFGSVRDTAVVTVGGTWNRATKAVTRTGSETGLIKRDIYGGGYGSNNYETKTTITAYWRDNETEDYTERHYTYTPMQFAGLVGKSTYVNIYGGQVMKNVYGGGEMASVGMINLESENDTWLYVTKHEESNNSNNFFLSWPYKWEYIQGFEGTTHVTVKGGRLGITGKDYMGPYKNGNPISWITGKELTASYDANYEDSIKAFRVDNGDVFGGGKGIAGPRYDYAFCANVGSTFVDIDINSLADATNYKDTTANYACIPGSVYGGGENGHVYDSTYVKLTKGLIGHAIYGGGKGKDTYQKELRKVVGTGNHIADIYSVTAGKVYGNTRVEMRGGTVMRNIYGGGNMASVGKGNYSGGPDDYSENGYGETLTENLWDSINDNSKAFLSSGKTTVIMTGGTLGTLTPKKPENSVKDDLPYGSIYGGCRGGSAPNINESPRYEYAPLFYSGYVNETYVQIGERNSTNGPTILGSVYGGGQDGHVRRDTYVEINSGKIGLPYVSADSALKVVGVSKMDTLFWLHRGNVYGSGSGIGKYEFDYNGDGDTKDTQLTYGTKPGTNEPNYVDEVGYSTSAGSVTRFTNVVINGGTIHHNVYGGGSLSSIGAPKIGQSYDEYRKGDIITSHGIGKQSLNQVTINGGRIGTPSDFNLGYGGNVYGASRGQAGMPSNFATSIWTEVNIGDTAKIAGNVFGGGEMGAVKQGVNVSINGGTMHDVYGGGALASTNTTSSVEYGKTVYPNTIVNLDGGTMHNVYGGGLGSLKILKINERDTIVSDVYATSGNVFVYLNQEHANDEGATGAIVDSIYGANNLNGTPLGHIAVHVFATQNRDTSYIGQKFHRRPVQGEKDEDETPQAYLQRLIDSVTVDLTETPKKYIRQVDGAIVSAAQTAYNTYAPVLANANSTQEQKDAALAAVNNSITQMQNQFMGLYDVSVVYGGGNLAPYIPTNSDSTEVIIDGCQVTSIRQVYGGGNAASVPATSVVVHGSYEIEEVFGGGNGRDPYTMFGNTYLNPGANVGYYNYTYFERQGNTNIYEPIEKSNARTKEDRALHHSYEEGSGVATTQIRGGKVHAVFGGSNEKGNIRTTALSVFEDAIDDCPVQVDESYGGGKNAPMDGKIELTLDCVKNMDMIFGGAKNADINSDVVLNITNGTYRQVFGGNNTGGALNGSITVNIKEEGCQPIEIDELYGGGYLAPYSIYGYEKDNNGNYVYYQVDENNKFIKNNGDYVVGTANNGKIMPLDSAAYVQLYPNEADRNPSRHPIINIISAKRVDNIYGGGYKAMMVGSPSINVNMEQGRMSVYKKITDSDTIYYDVDRHQYDYHNLDSVPYTEGNETKYRYYTTLDLGHLGNIYGGGYMADVVGSTQVDIGTGQWIKWIDNALVDEMIGTVNTINGNKPTTFTYRKHNESSTTKQWSYISGTDNNGNPVISYLAEGVRPTPTRNKAIITGDVFGGGDHADVTGNATITIGDMNNRGNQDLKVNHNIYGGGKMGSIGDTIRTVKHVSEPKSDGALYDFALSWPVEVQYREGTGNTYINIYDGRIGTTGADDGDVFGGGKGQAADRFTEAGIANVNNTYVKIDYGNITPDLDVPGNVTIEYLLEDAKKNLYEDKLVIKRDLPAITGSVYGGSENGHVIGDTHLDLINGVVGHVLYGGGKGKGKYQGYLYDYEHWKNNHTQANFRPQNEGSQKDLYSLTAGKVYGNTYVNMKNGHVMRNVFGGGNLGSVGIGNYAGGKDDYSEIGYGELPPEDNGELWSNTLFTGTGNTHVTIEDGIVGFILKPIAKEANEEDEAYTTRLNNTLTPNSDNYGSYTLASINEIIRTLALKDSLPTGNVFGGCRGQASANIDQQARPRYKYLPDYFLGYVNETEVRIGTATTHPVIMGSVYGGGQDGHVRRNAVVIIDNAQVGIPYDADNRALVGDLTVTANNKTSENPHWVRRGNVFGAGSGIGRFKNPGPNEAPYNYSSGSVTAATSVHINDISSANSDSTVIYGNVYGGGAIASVGPPPTNQEYIEYKAVETFTTGTDGLIHYSFSNNDADTNHVKQSYTGTMVTITGGTIGNANTPTYGGEVFGASRGNSSWGLNPALFSTDGWATVNISGGTVNRNVFGGGEAGMVKNDATVNVSGTSTIIGRDLFGGGDQADVKGNTSVSISGGWIKKSVYGGGNMGSIGDTIQTVVHDSVPKSDGALYNFALSWPVDVQYREGTGNTHVSVTGGRIGITGKDYMLPYRIEGNDTLDVNGDKITSKEFKDAREDNGDIYGGGKGITADRYTEATIANVNHTLVEISYGTDVDSTNIGSYVTINDDKVVINDGFAVIHGSVYGGGENGHVIDSTHVIITKGLIGHSVYGGGKGKDTYQGKLKDFFNPSHPEYETKVSSITAGKVYGNTRITMNGGYVLRNIYGGGNLASVGKGNYAGGTDDYMVVGYGELPSKINGQEAPLWENKDFMNSGIATVTVNSGTVGYFNASETNIKAFTKDDLPTGNVFGSCRGQAAPNYFISPRYKYFPEYFFGYVNETRVTIGNDTVAKGPRIYGSVYGGGQDGHVRRDASVTVNKGTIGLTYDQFSSKIPENTPISSTQFKDRGNVYGAGSGIGKYEFKTSLKSTVDNSKDSVEVGYNYSSGSVTGVTKIQINSGSTIYQNVYGGGSLASVGPPMTGDQTGVDFDEFNNDTVPYTRPASFSQYTDHKSKTTTHVIINGGTIGEAKGYAAGYGGNVFGASRGNISNLAIPAADLGKFATTIWTKVEASKGHILGNVYGGGESGAVKRDTYVEIGGIAVPQTSHIQRRSEEPAQTSQQQTEPNAQPQQNSVNGAQGNAATESMQPRTINTNRANQ